MTKKRVKATVNPAVLVWARTSAGFDLSAAAGKLDVDDEKLAAWEAGDDQPTISKLRQLTELYKRPLAVLYMPEPPLAFHPQKERRANILGGTAVAGSRYHHTLCPIAWFGFGSGARFDVSRVGSTPSRSPPVHLRSQRIDRRGARREVVVVADMSRRSVRSRDHREGREPGSSNRMMTGVRSPAPPGDAPRYRFG